MQDPSQGVQRELQPHAHLVSTYRFPQLPQLHPDKVAEWLLAAPKISRDQAPFYWTYLDRPADGTILLVWQSLSLGTEFPSDGFVWTPQETAFSIEVHGGYTLEMYQQKAGFAPNEQVATHSRRRYRLLPSKFQNAAGMPDTSLWIIHYTQADPQDRVPSSVIPIDMRVQQSMSTRQYLQSHGQIVQKEFMLHDRANWPQIPFPRGPPRGPPMYGGAVPQTRIPQTMAYPTQHATPGPPAKRVRTQASSNPSGASGAIAVLELDDEEDTSRGDLFDHTTPRELSLARYKQNHEWMEEILSSPYSINQIIPADLGLGVRGELASLTEGTFDAPLDPDKDVAKHNYVGRLDPEKAEQFRKRANERILQTNKEIEKMQAKHAKRLARFQKGTILSKAEKELRTAVNDPSDTGPEYWRLEGKIDEDSAAEDGKSVSRQSAKVEDIVAKVEASVGRHAAQVKELIRIQDGGFEEAPEPLPQVERVLTPRISPPGSNNGSTHSGVLVTDADLDMSNSAAGLLDQYHTGLSSNATPGSTNNFPTPQPLLHHAGSSANTPNNLHVPSPQPTAHSGGDIAMSDAHEASTESGQGTAGDWVVVPPGGVSPTVSSSTLPHPVTQNAPQPHTSTSTPLAGGPSPLPTTTAPTSSLNTPLPDFHASPNDFADLGDLNSAGDALASYTPHDHDDHGLDVDLDGSGLGDLGDIEGMGEIEGMDDVDVDVGMDDGAFGDAFHGIDTPGAEIGEGHDGLGDGI